MKLFRVPGETCKFTYVTVWELAQYVTKHIPPTRRSRFMDMCLALQPSMKAASSHIIVERKQ